MTFLSHPTCSGFIHDFMDHYTLEWQHLQYQSFPLLQDKFNSCLVILAHFL